MSIAKYYDNLNIERAIDDLRRGMPVLVSVGSDNFLVAAAEESSGELSDFIADLGGKNGRLLLTGNRMKYLLETESAAKKLPVAGVQISEVQKLCGLYDWSDLSVGASKFFDINEKEQFAIDLIKHTELLPSSLVYDVDIFINSDDWANQKSLVSITSSEISAYVKTNLLKRSCEAPLNLKYAKNVTIYGYRPPMGGHEHYAIVVGNVSKNKVPLIRVHSSCYTGDLLGSLSCDCGEQLTSAIEIMNTHDGGGILIYLMQEGRGIGLTNKLRTYVQQAAGLDTVDANEILGFEDDVRLFQPAAEILEDLNCDTVKLLSNNPRKAKSLEEYHINVAEIVPHIMETNEYNDNYIKTKASRLGHVFK